MSSFFFTVPRFLSRDQCLVHAYRHFLALRRDAGGHLRALKILVAVGCAEDALKKVSTLPGNVLARAYRCDLLRSPSGYIDLSKRRVNPEDMKACEDRFQKAKQVRTNAAP